MTTLTEKINRVMHMNRKIEREREKLTNSMGLREKGESP